MNYFGFNTVVLTTNGYKEISDIQPGDSLISSNGNTAMVKRIEKKQLSVSDSNILVLDSRLGFSSLLLRNSSLGIYDESTHTTTFKPLHTIEEKELLVMPAFSLFSNQQSNTLSTDQINLLAAYFMVFDGFNDNGNLIVYNDHGYRKTKLLDNNFTKAIVNSERSAFLKVNKYTATSGQINFLAEYFGKNGKTAQVSLLSLPLENIKAFLKRIRVGMVEYVTVDGANFTLSNKTFVCALQMLELIANRSLISVSKTGYSQNEIFVRKIIYPVSRLFEITTKSPPKKLNNKISKYRIFDEDRPFVMFNNVKPLSIPEKTDSVAQRLRKRLSTEPDDTEKHPTHDFFGFELDKDMPIFVDNILMMP